MFLRPSMVVTERSETVLAQIVLAAQERAEAEAERDEDSLPCLVWNDIREAARVRATFSAGAHCPGIANLAMNIRTAPSIIPL